MLHMPITLVFLLLLLLHATVISSHNTDNPQMCGQHLFDWKPVINDISFDSDPDQRVLQSYENIRILFDYSNLKGVSSSFIDYIQNVVLPPVKNYFEAAIKVKPVSGKIMTKSSICGISVPYKYTVAGGGVEADLVIFLTASYEPEKSYSAYAGPCVLDRSTNRTVFGILNFNLAFIIPSTSDIEIESDISVSMHEVTHALGFTIDTFDKFTDPTTNKGRTGHYYRKIVNGVSTLVLNLPPLTSRLRAHFNCPTLEGAYLENQGGLSGSADSHFERRVFFNELMTASATQDTRVSEFTLAFLEGTGWYQVDYSMAEPMTYGKNKGCSFLDSTCLDTSTTALTPRFEEFCAPIGSTGCSWTLRGGAGCGISNSYGDPNLIQAFNYWGDKRIVRDRFSDNCPMYKIYSNYDCEDIANQANSKAGESFGYGSKCFLGTLYPGSGAYTELVAYCFKPTCETRNGGGYTLKFKVGNISITCSTAGDITVEGYGGILKCPDPVKFCTQIESEGYCKRKCSGRGSCVNKVCQCVDGWTFHDCSKSTYTDNCARCAEKDPLRTTCYGDTCVCNPSNTTCIGRDSTKSNTSTADSPKNSTSNTSTDTNINITNPDANTNNTSTGNSTTNNTNTGDISTNNTSPGDANDTNTGDNDTNITNAGNSTLNNTSTGNSTGNSSTTNNNNTVDTGTNNTSNGNSTTNNTNTEDIGKNNNSLGVTNDNNTGENSTNNTNTGNSTINNNSTVDSPKNSTTSHTSNTATNDDTIPDNSTNSTNDQDSEMSNTTTGNSATNNTSTDLNTNITNPDVNTNNADIGNSTANNTTIGDISTDNANSGNSTSSENSTTNNASTGDIDTNKTNPGDTNDINTGNSTIGTGGTYTNNTSSGDTNDTNTGDNNTNITNAGNSTINNTSTGNSTRNSSTTNNNNTVDTGTNNTSHGNSTTNNTNTEDIGKNNNSLGVTNDNNTGDNNTNNTNTGNSTINNTSTVDSPKNSTTSNTSNTATNDDTIPDNSTNSTNNQDSEMSNTTTGNSTTNNTSTDLNTNITNPDVNTNNADIGNSTANNTTIGGTNTDNVNSENSTSSENSTTNNVSTGDIDTNKTNPGGTKDINTGYTGTNDTKTGNSTIGTGGTYTNNTSPGDTNDTNTGDNDTNIINTGNSTTNNTITRDMSIDDSSGDITDINNGIINTRTDKSTTNNTITGDSPENSAKGIQDVNTNDTGSGNLTTNNTDIGETSTNNTDSTNNATTEDSTTNNTHTEDTSSINAEDISTNIFIPDIDTGNLTTYDNSTVANTGTIVSGAFGGVAAFGVALLIA